MPFSPGGTGDIDADLVRAAQRAPEGDTRAFEQLVKQHQRRIVANCRYLTRDEGQAEDLAQEVFVKAYFGLKSFEGNSSFGHWLRRIKVNHCLNHLKRNEGQVAIDLAEEFLQDDERLQVAPLAEQSIETSHTRQRIGRVLSALPLTLRIPLVMRDMDELSYEEVATALGIGLSATKMRIKRAREEFRRLYNSVTSSSGQETV